MRNYNPFRCARVEAFANPETQALHDALQAWRITMGGRYLSGKEARKGFTAVSTFWYTDASKRHWSICKQYDWDACALDY